MERLSPLARPADPLAVLRWTRALRHASPDIRDRLAPHWQVRSCACGESLANAGDLGTSLLVLASGAMVVTFASDGSLRTLEIRDRGTMVGEEWCLASRRWPASFAAKGHGTVVLLLPFQVFREVLTESSEFALQYASGYIQRRRELTRLLHFSSHAMAEASLDSPDSFEDLKEEKTSSADLGATLRQAFGLPTGAWAGSVPLLSCVADLLAAKDANPDAFPGLRLRHYTPGAIVCREGASATECFFVQAGLLDAVVYRPPAEAADAKDGPRGLKVAAFGPGDVFGQWGLFSGERRAATVSGTAASTVLSLSQDALLALWPYDSELLFRCIGGSSQELEYDWLIDLALERRQARGGDMVFAEGEPSDAVFIVCHGRVRILPPAARRGERLRSLAELTEGSMFGETGILLAQGRGFGAVCVRDSSLYRIGAAAFMAYLDCKPSLKTHYFRMACARQCRSVLKLSGTRSVALDPHERPPCRILGVVTLADVPEEAASDLEHLVTALRTYGPVHELREAYSRNLLSQARHIDALSATFRSIVLHLPASAVRARDFDADAFRNVDAIVLLARQPTTRLAFARLQAAAACQDLFVVHLHGTPEVSPCPWHTANAWKAAWGEDIFASVAWQHVSLPRPETFRRLARFVLQCHVKIVLSGGGLAAFRHIGGLAALRRRRIPIDVVAGTSAGALVAALYATLPETSPDAVRAVLTAACGAAAPGAALADLAFLTDPSVLPLHALASGLFQDTLCEEFFGALRLEDLGIKVLVTATDVNANALVNYTAGEVAPLVRASGNLPILFPPVVFDGRLLVDGGVMRNLPVESAHDFAPGGTCIALDVDLQADLAPPPPPDLRLLSRSSAMVVSEAAIFAAKRLLGIPVARPTLPDIVSLTQAIVTLPNDMDHKRARSLADLCITYDRTGAPTENDATSGLEALRVDSLAALGDSAVDFSLGTDANRELVHMLAVDEEGSSVSKGRRAADLCACLHHDCLAFQREPYLRRVLEHRPRQLEILVSGMLFSVCFAPFLVLLAM